MNQQPDDLLEILRSIGPFADIDASWLSKIERDLQYRKVEPGAALVEQGDYANSVFIVVSGRFEVLVRDEPGGGERRVDELAKGSIFGEIALVVGGPRSATVRAVTEAKVIEFSRESFSHLLEADVETIAPFSALLDARMRRLKIRKPLEDIFGERDNHAIDEIIRKATWVRLARGKELFRQGDMADGAYIVASGQLHAAVASDSDSGERVIDEVGAGQWIGEMALLASSTRSATVYAVRDSELLWLSRAYFEELMTRYPKAIFETSRRLVHRLEEQMKFPVRRPKPVQAFALVSATPHLDLREFARDLVSNLERYGSVLHLTSEEIDRHLGVKGISQISEDHPARLRLEPWLLEQETNHRFIVYETDREWSGWSDRAIRHADHVILVADSRFDPMPVGVEARMATQFSGRMAVKRSLVLLHPADRVRYSGTARWLMPRAVDVHHHIRRGSNVDVGRLARTLTGNAIAMVLGGGGSRGWAHVGVLKACEELGIPIDAIGGTSVGGLLASVAAFGMKTDEILDQIEPILRTGMDITLPLVSMVRGKRVMDGLHKIGGDIQIEDLQIPFFAISTNLTRGEQVIHRRGSLALAVRATTSVPGVFPPVPYQGDLLVDGGLSNNLPVDAMASQHHGPIIAVDVIPAIELSTRAGDLPLWLSGWDFAWRKIRPLGRTYDMPNIVSILMRSVSVTSHGFQKIAMAEQVAELFLRPPVDEWNPLDFGSAHASVEQGYRATYPELARWWANARQTRMGQPAKA
jgi:predicted acylesterase/phospholipase RssA/CRP-like cAMP-binding protein